MCARKANLGKNLANVLSVRMTRLRKLANLTQAQVAQKVGINQPNYSHYEKGVRAVPLKRLAALAKALDTDVNELLGASGEFTFEGPADPMHRRLELINQLPVQSQRKILEMIDNMVAKSGVKKRKTRAQVKKVAKKKTAAKKAAKKKVSTKKKTTVKKTAKKKSVTKATTKQTRKKVAKKKRSAKRK